MKFTDHTHNIEIEIFSTSSCKLTIFDGNLALLEGANKILNAHARRAQLDGGTAVKFTHNLNLAEKHITITGDLFEAIQTLCTYERISVDRQDEIILYLIAEDAKKAFKAISSGAQSVFMSKIQAAVLPSPPHSPALFSH